MDSNFTFKNLFFVCYFIFLLSTDVLAQHENVYAIHQEELAINNSDFHKILFECNETLKHDANNKEALYKRGVIKTELGSFKSAQNDFTKALHLAHGNKVDIYYRRGISYFLENDFLNAISDFDSAIHIQPNHVKALWKKAQSYYQIGAQSLTLKTLDQISIVNPEDAVTWHDMGTLYHKNHQPHKAKDCFTTALILDPKMSSSYNHRGMIYESLDEIAKAFDDYNRAIFYDSAFVDAYNNRGLIYLKFEDFVEAENDFSSAITHGIHLHKEALNNRAITRYLTGRFSESLTDINTLINNYPYYANAYITRGNIKERLHDDAGACSDWHKAAELGMLVGLKYAQGTCH
ncbi:MULTISPECIES: tetratricopeptide repeat protein [Flammeovirga]|uniref:Tetratricopeptide repeat protein n=1 Tax=Flammeovirga agarivorans TaxID=2726742 RepID=A0A7X8SQ09_9BACT|nr:MULTISPECIES: tetratricopeptide repeat protein [Flammeovirga]NLR94210.1 hypothetical protein [Flammeovirga agarivorans]